MTRLSRLAYSIQDWNSAGGKCFTEIQCSGGIFRRRRRGSHRRAYGSGRQGRFCFGIHASGQIDGYQRINQLQEWVASDGVPVELMLQSDRVLWTPRRAFVLGAADRGDDLVNSLVTFTFFESRLSRLEEEVFALLGKVSHDSHLTHQVGRRDLRRWSDVNDITRRLWSFRACFAAIEPRLEKAPLSLSGQARRLYSELFVIGELADRCEALDGQLEVLEDLYESANDRLSEFSYFSKEYLLEAIIIGVLAVDLALTIIDLFVIGH